MRLRSVLFAPANQPSLVRKLPRWSPDAVVVDLKDSVPPDAKESARSAALMLVAELALANRGLKILLRTNSPASPWFQADLVAASVRQGLSGVVVPKLEDACQLEAIGLPTVAGIETARGVYEVRRLLGPPVVAVYFGAEDFISDLGAGAQWQVLRSHRRGRRSPLPHVLPGSRLWTKSLLIFGMTGGSEERQPLLPTSATPASCVFIRGRCPSLMQPLPRRHMKLCAAGGCWSWPRRWPLKVGVCSNLMDR